MKTIVIDALREEFGHEAATTRRLLERLPEDRLAWRPHEKSYTAGDLAAHIVDCVGWCGPIFRGDEFDMDPTTYAFCAATSVSELLRVFDAHVEEGKRALAAARDEGLDNPWQLKVRGRTHFERPRGAALRDMCLSHLIHHRGQLSVYLRLLDVPVPGSYGPTADESF